MSAAGAINGTIATGYYTLTFVGDVFAVLHVGFLPSFGMIRMCREYGYDL